MPVSIGSRYQGLPVYEAADAEGDPAATIAVRPTPAPPPVTATYQHVVSGAETVEYLAWRYYGSSAAWWRIADANPAIFPLDLQTGATVSVPTGEDIGRVVRTRRF